MDEYPLLTNMMLLTSGIKACMEKQAVIPALVLIYSAVDTTCWLDSTEAFSTRNDFIRWVENYLLKVKPMKCTAIDLYAARCGLLHTSTPDSQLSSSGKARVINYAWGKAKVEDVQRLIDLKNRSNESVAVHVNELYQAWLSGLALWGQDLDKDSDRSDRVLAKAKKFFAELGVGTMSEILSATDSNKP
jgi:glycogen debranching enzyme